MAACMACGKDIGSRGYRPRSVGFTAPIIERAGSMLRAGGAPAPLVCMSCALDKEHKARVRLVVSSTAMVVLAGGLWVAFATGTVARVRNAMAPAPVTESATSQPVAECAPEQTSSASAAGDGGPGSGAVNSPGSGAVNSPGSGAVNSPGGGAPGNDTSADGAGGGFGAARTGQVNQAANGKANGGAGGSATAAPVSCRVRDWRSALREQSQF